MPYKLHYFNGRGRGEVIRFLFIVAGQDFEDVRTELADWPKVKPDTPTGVLPYLETPEGEVMVQSNAIIRYLARKFNLHGKTDSEFYKGERAIEQIIDTFEPFYEILFGPEDKRAEFRKDFVETKGKYFLTHLTNFLAQSKTGFFAGDTATVADFTAVHLTYSLRDVTPELLDQFPALEEHYNKVLEFTPTIKEWIAKRPKTFF